MIQELRRLLVIGWVFFRRNLFFALYRDVYHRHIADRDCSCEADQQLRERAKKLREALEELGPTFVKLGQILSRRPDLLPPPYIIELAHNSYVEILQWGGSGNTGPFCRLRGNCHIKYGAGALPPAGMTSNPVFVLDPVTYANGSFTTSIHQLEYNNSISPLT